ncbi:hypothetical protein ACOMHN_058030 [Nucella lapillus]
MAGLVFVAALTVGWGPGREATASPQPVTAAMFHRLPGADVLFTAHVLGHQPARWDCCCRLLHRQEVPCGLWRAVCRGRPVPPVHIPFRDTRCSRHLPQTQEEEESPSGTDDVGAWSKNWIQKNCSSTSDCREPMAACFSGQCLCDGGFFFDHTENACVSSEYNAPFVSSCTRGLGNTYLEYKAMDFNGHDAFDTSASGDPLTCHTKCSADPTCVLIVYGSMWKKGQGRCFYKNVTSRDFPLAWKPRSETISYQRQCL